MSSNPSDSRSGPSGKSDKKKVLIFVVAYNAERFIQAVLHRIPETMWSNDDFESEVLIIDDSSSDQTFEEAERTAALSLSGRKIEVLFNPQNQGYGGNQKIGYHYALRNGFDAVVMLHGDGQYGPEYLPEMVAPIVRGDSDAVFGSRMLKRLDAVKGRMPLYKWFGNQILTGMQNAILGTRLSEFHTGYRAFRVSTLAQIPFDANSDYFDFDTDIIIQLVLAQKKISEIPIQTHYGDEVCHVDGLRYARLILKACVLARIQKLGLFYVRKFDVEGSGNSYYSAKFGFSSSHEFALQAVDRAGLRVLDLGSGPGFMARQLAEAKSAKVISVDRVIQEETRRFSEETLEADMDLLDFKDLKFADPDVIFALDIIEHLRRPEVFMSALRELFPDKQPQLVITTGNVSFAPVRLNHLMGFFNYGKRGILDRDHTRLFTFQSLKQCLETCGYEILKVSGIPAPVPLALGRNRFSSFLLRVNEWLIRVSRGFFAYQIGIIARPKPTLDTLLHRAFEGRKSRIMDSGLSFLRQGTLLEGPASNQKDRTEIVGDVPPAAL